ncbi:MAG: hypothetical protein HQL20_10605 [Candidatus Omnitrophica bacterium]|nr:hypothetical protein [Candidatus Omnitrophota bacterium]
MNYALPWLISLLQGFFLLTAIIPVTARPRMLLLVFWGALTGMATTALLTFTSFIFFNTLVPAYVITINLGAALWLFFLAKRNTLILPFTKGTVDKLDLIGVHLLLVCTIPVVLHALLFPDGGWDAWSCWNLKARFLFLGAENWRGMLDPALWRSNTAYPLLLPLENVWYWSFGDQPNTMVTLATSCRITFLMAGLLFFGLKELGGKASALLAPLWLMSIMFFVKLASSQYSDLLVGVWFLSALLAFRLFKERGHTAYLLLALMSLGFMSFTKSEGLVLAVIALTAMGLDIILSADSRKAALNAWPHLAWAAGLAFSPTIYFQLCLAPDSHTFINGLVSATKPASIERLQAALMFLGIEVLSPKWNGFWLILAGGIILAGIKALRRGLWVVPAIIGLYLLSVVAVYTINTFFEIFWWLSTTLNRILFALLPALVFWLFSTLQADPKYKNRAE